MMTKSFYIKNSIVVLCILLVDISSAYSAPVPKCKSNTHQESVVLVNSETTLKQGIETSIKNKRSLSSMKIGISIFDLKNNQFLYQNNGHMSYNIASGVKIITTALALQKLGSGYRFQTVVTMQHPNNQGIVEGNLYIKGFGDPSLNIEALEQIVKQIKRRGIKKINGSLILDQGYFDNNNSAPHFEERPYEPRAFRAPISALSTNFNTIGIHIYPAQNNQNAYVTLSPSNKYLHLMGKVNTSHKRSRIQLNIDNQKDFLQVQVGGYIQENSKPRIFYRHVPNPFLFFGHTFLNILSKNNVDIVSKDFKHGVAPLNIKPLFIHKSRTLTHILRDMNKYSNNFISEMIFKTIGAHEKKSPATWEKSQKIIRDFLVDDIKLAPNSFRMNNGSGLYNSNRFSTDQVIQILTYLHHDFRYNADILSTLSIAGTDGTMKKRMNNSALLLRAKTGSLSKTSFLGGYAAINTDRVIAFAITMNNLPYCRSRIAHARKLQDDIASLIIQYLRNTAPKKLSSHTNLM